MDVQLLFLKTLEDLQKKIESNDVYEILMSTALLRKLLIDANLLVDQVNRSKKLKVVFTINDRKAPSADGLVFWSIKDDFDPETSVPHLTKTLEVRKDRMLASPLMVIQGKTISVLELIKFISHVQGSVHSGSPSDEKEKVLKAAEETLTIGGMPGGIRSIKAVGRVVLKALEPLKLEITRERL